MEEEEKSDPLLEEAMDWLLRMEDAPGDLEALRRFELWLSRSPAHRNAWKKARETWRLVGQVPPAYEHLWRESAPASAGARPARRRPGAVSGRPHRRRARVAAAAALAAAALVLVLAAPAILLQMQADYVTATAESRTVRLDDGSMVTLGADSAIAADIGEDGRHVTLLSGEAFFDVEHDASRPFVVDAQGVDVTVLGTAFDVRLSDRSTTVELARGSVGVSFDRGEMRGQDTLVPLEMIVIDRETGVMRKSAIAGEDIGAWRNGRIFVQDATVGSVIEQLQRYHSAWIGIPDGTLAGERVTGLYDLDDPDRALAALVRPFGGKVRKISPYLRVVSRF